MVIANQYLQQLAGNTLEAIMGNVGTMLIFKVGLRDAQAFQRFTKPRFTAEDLLSIRRFKAVLKMQHQGESLPAFIIETLPPIALPDDAEERAATIRKRSQETYAKPRQVVDEAIQRRFERSFDGAGRSRSKQVDISEVSFFD